MARLLKYFRVESQQKKVFPDPNGSTSQKIPSSLIALVNDIVLAKTTPRGS